LLGFPGEPFRGIGRAALRIGSPTCLPVRRPSFAVTLLHVLHADVDVEDEVAHLLHGSPGGPVRVDPLREVACAAVAVAELRPGGDFLLHVGRDRYDLEAAPI
jgi:hypothetical protein